MAGTLSLPVSLNLKDFKAALGQMKAGLASVASAPITALANAFGPAIDGAKKLGAAVQNAQLAIGALSVGLAAGFREAITAYNADQSAAAKLADTFGSNAGIVKDAVNDIASSTDRSVGDLQGMASQFGVLISAAGLTKQRTAELSAQFTQTAVDMAARFGKPIEQVMEGIDGALKGREQGLKEFGITLTDVAKQAEATSLGFDPEHLTDEQTARVNLNLIIQQSIKFQGAAAAAAGTLRDSMRRLADQTGELKGAIGGALESAVLPLVNGTLNAVKAIRTWIEANPELAQTIGAASIAFTAFGTGLTSLAGALAIGLPLLQAFLAPLAAFLSPVSALVVSFTALLSGTALGGLIVGFAKFVANGKGVMDVVDGIQSAVSKVSGAFDTLKAGISSIGQNVFKRLEADAGSAGNFFDDLGTRISSALKGAFEFILPVADRVVNEVITIFEGIPKVIDAIKETFGTFGAFFSSVVSIITGDTQKVSFGFDDLETTATGVVTGLSNLLKAPAIIAGLGAIRIALAGVVAGFGFLYEGAQLVVSGVEILFSGVMAVLNGVVQGIALVFPSAQKFASDFEALMVSLGDDGVARSEEAQSKIGQIAQKLASETVSALDQINDPSSMIKRLEAEQAERKKTLAIAKQLREEEAKRVADEKQLAGFREDENNTNLAFDEKSKANANEKIALNAKQAEGLKRATDEAVQAELSVLDARAKANGLLSDELKLLEMRRQLELKAAIERKASLEEQAQINRKFNAQGQGMREERQRQNDAKSDSVQEFARGKRNDALGRSGSRADQDQAKLNNIGKEVSAQLDGVQNESDLGAIIDTLHKMHSEVTENLKRDIEAKRKAIKNATDPDEKEALRDDLNNMLHAQNNDSDVMSNQERLAKQIGRDNIAKVKKDNADSEPDSKAQVDLSPLEQGKQIIQQMGEKFQGLVDQLNSGLQGFAVQVASLATATAALVKTSEVFPTITTSLQAMVSNQTAFGDALNSFGGECVTQITAMTALLASQTAVLKQQQAAIKANADSLQANRDATASFGGI